MALANDFTDLLDKIEDDLGLRPLTPHLPSFATKDKWADRIRKKTLPEFSRYYPNKLPLVVNDETCYKRKENDGKTWYYIKDEILQGVKLLGVLDIDWMDHTNRNASLGVSNASASRYYPTNGCIASTFETMVGLQMAADISSLYNRGICIDYKDPGKFCVVGTGNTDYDLTSFVVSILVEHVSLSTISPTKMTIFEQLATADVARFLYMNLRYFEGFETAYINIDLKLSELQEEAGKRESIMDKIEQSYVSTSNENIPYIWTVN